MDADNQGRLYVSDIESFVMPQLRQIISTNNINKTNFNLTLSEMTGNISLAIMRKADFNVKGNLEERDLVQLQQDDPVGYRLLEDLLNFAPDFMDTHRQVING